MMMMMMTTYLPLESGVEVISYNITSVLESSIEELSAV